MTDSLTTARTDLATLEARLAKLRRLRRSGVPAVLKELAETRLKIMKLEFPKEPVETPPAPVYRTPRVTEITPGIKIIRSYPRRDRVPRVEQPALQFEGVAA